MDRTVWTADELHCATGLSYALVCHYLEAYQRCEKFHASSI